MLRGYTEKLTAGSDLSEEEAATCLELILSSETPDTEIANFLRELFLKGETSAEIAGFARVMRQHAVSVESNHDRFIDTAGTGGGSETFNISTAAAFVIAGAGLAVAKHGNRAATSRSGSADVLTALGVRIDPPAGVAERCLDELGIAFLFAPLFHPAMKRVVGVRRQLTHRTIFNLLGPLTNPASAPYQLIGVYSSELTAKLASALSSLGCRRAWVVHSGDGLDELSTASGNWVSEVSDQEVTHFRFDPPKHGLKASPISSLVGGTPEENASIIRQILEGRTPGAPRDVVVLNAAAALHVAGESEFGKALARAAESIDSGAAQHKLEGLIEAYDAG